MTCATCGQRNVEDARFCSQCGSRLDSRAEAGSYRPLDIRQAERPPGSLPSRDLGGLVSETFAIYGRNFWQFVLIAFIAEIPGLAAAVMPWFLSWMLSLLGIILAFVAGPAMIHAVVQQYIGDRQIDVRECYSRALSRVIVILAAIIMIGLALTVTGLLSLILIGIPLFFYLLVSWFFAPQAIMVENQGPIAALSRSRALVRGSWWRVFGIGIVFWLLVVALFIPGIIAGIILGLINETLGSLVFTLSSVVVFPIFNISATLVYIDLRVRKEGYDLEAMAAEVSSVPSGFSI